MIRDRPNIVNDRLPFKAKFRSITDVLYANARNNGRKSIVLDQELAVDNPQI